MKFEPKISGTRVDDYDIRLNSDVDIVGQFISLSEVLEKVHRQETMDYLLDNYRFSKGTDGNWYAIIAIDDAYKIAILERYPGYEAEMIDYFGEGWLKHYIRFSH